MGTTVKNILIFLFLSLASGFGMVAYYLHNNNQQQVGPALGGAAFLIAGSIAFRNKISFFEKIIAQLVGIFSYAMIRSFLEPLIMVGFFNAVNSQERVNIKFFSSLYGYSSLLYIALAVLVSAITIKWLSRVMPQPPDSNP